MSHSHRPPRAGSNELTFSFPPRSDDPCLTRLFSFQYDFSTEKKALDVFQSNLLQYSSPAKVDPPQSDIDSSVEIESSTASSASSSCSSIPAGEETPYEMPATISYPLESVSSMPPLRPSSAVSTTLSSTPHRPSPSMNGILQPVIAKASAIRSVNKDPEPSRPVLRLEDFENVTCSPFDMVELKSINDIEELRRLWTHHPPNGFAS